ncbi:hypothetical protein ABE16_00005, partial [Bacillus thuringiensis]|nr:hypothetical protein [Bacillus thuringiensis]
MEFISKNVYLENNEKVLYKYFRLKGGVNLYCLFSKIQINWIFVMHLNSRCNMTFGFMSIEN